MNENPLDFISISIALKCEIKNYDNPSYNRKFVLQKAILGLNSSIKENTVCILKGLIMLEGFSIFPSTRERPL